jgi:hypothetical protein
LSKAHHFEPTLRGFPARTREFAEARRSTLDESVVRLRDGGQIVAASFTLDDAVISLSKPVP